MAEIVKAKVFRYNPGIDPEPYYKTYEVPWRELMSVLELLRYIHEEIEPISFDYSCRTSVCGMCAMAIDGKPQMACVALVPNDREIVIEPLPGFPVIKDLIIDRTEVQSRLYGIRPWFSRIKPMTEPETMPPKAFVDTLTLQLCKDCMCCHSACPVLKEKGFHEFAGPFILTKIAMRYKDSREDAQDERLKTAVREGLFNCILCGTCDSVCPVGELIEIPEYPDAHINHVRVFKEMMDEAEAKGWKP